MPEDRSDIRIQAPLQGWDLLFFVDGYSAMIVGGTAEIKDGKDYSRLLLYPYPELKKRYKIQENELTKSGCIEKIYPKDMIMTLNEDDPARKLRFCMLSFDGKETPATKWFKGSEQNKEIERLRAKIEQIRVHNAILTEENLMLKINVPKFIKLNFTSLVDDLMPLFKQYIVTREEAGKQGGM